jgi:2-methylcitrate dehydratase PrpD
MSVTGTLVAFAAEAGDAAPERVPTLVASLVDTVGVALPGAASLPALARWDAADPAPGGATVWCGGSASPSRAALLNGTAGHALDFDDAVPGSPLHPSTVLWPAVLTVAETRGRTWTDAFAAVDVGNAALRAVTEVLPGDVHYARGWHTTSTVGRIAGVVALVRLLRLDATVAHHAVGIAASMAAGSRASFGTATKPLHAGLAAHDAVVAVALAEAGIDAHPDQLDAPLGFLAQYGEAGPRDGFAVELAAAARTWPQQWSLKRHPSCYGTHYAVDAALALAPAVDAATVQRVDVRVHPGSLRPLIDRAPTSGLEARFSLEHCVAVALVDGAVGLDAFDDAAIRRPDVVAVRERVQVHAEDGDRSYAHVRVVTASGEHERQVTVTRGDARDPLTEAEVDAKAVECAVAAGWGEGDARSLVAHLRRAPQGGPVDLAPLRRHDGGEG